MTAQVPSYSRQSTGLKGCLTGLTGDGGAHRVVLAAPPAGLGLGRPLQPVCSDRGFHPPQPHRWKQSVQCCHRELRRCAQQLSLPFLQSFHVLPGNPKEQPGSEAAIAIAQCTGPHLCEKQLPAPLSSFTLHFKHWLKVLCFL